MLRPLGYRVPPGAETTEIRGCGPFVWEHDAPRHSFISYWLAPVPNTAQVALEAGNSPQMILGHYRELVRAMDAEKWFGVTSASVEAVKAARESRAAGKIVALPKVAVAQGRRQGRAWWVR